MITDSISFKITQMQDESPDGKVTLAIYHNNLCTEILHFNNTRDALCSIDNYCYLLPEAGYSIKGGKVKIEIDYE